MIRITSFLVLVLYSASSLAANDHSFGQAVKELTLERRVDTRACTILSSRQLPKYRGLDSKTSHSFRLSAQANSETFRVVARNDDTLWSRVHAECESVADQEMQPGEGLSHDSSQKPFAFLSETQSSMFPTPKLEIVPLLQTGSSSNRVDLVFFSDGCKYSITDSFVALKFTYILDTQEEKGKFIKDAKRLADDVSNNQTFNTVKPLLNFWAAFTPSDEVRLTEQTICRGEPLTTRYNSRAALVSEESRKSTDQCRFLNFLLILNMQYHLRPVPRRHRTSRCLLQQTCCCSWYVVFHAYIHTHPALMSVSSCMQIYARTM